MLTGDRYQSYVFQEWIIRIDITYIYSFGQLPSVNHTKGAFKVLLKCLIVAIDDNLYPNYPVDMDGSKITIFLEKLGRCIDVSSVYYYKSGTMIK